MKDYTITIRTSGVVVVDKPIAEIPTNLLPLLLAVVEGGEYTGEPGGPSQEDIADRLRIEITTRSQP